MTRPKLRMLNPASKTRAVGLGAHVRTLGAAPAVKTTLDFYGSAAWKKLLREIIAERGRRCEDINCRTPNRGEGGKIYGDHEIELRDGGAPLDKRNVKLKCPPCHGIKTAKAREARAARQAKAEAAMLHRTTTRGGDGRESGRGASTARGPWLEGASNPGTFFSPGVRR